MADGKPILGSLYIYAPNKVAPVIFTVAYGISAFFHLWQCYRYKAWRMIWMQSFCAVLFTAGYALREYGAFNYMYTKGSPNLFIFIVSQVFIYVCPPLLELSNYHILGRIFYYAPHLAPLPPGLVLAIFGGIMALVEALNAIGVSLQANPSGATATQHLGSQLMIGAISIQVAVIVCFILMASVFHYRCIKSNALNRTIRTPLYTLYASMVLIFVRCIYRLVEHLGPTAIHLNSQEKLDALTPILRFEWYFYVFEALLMFLNSLLWNVFHPGRYLPASHMTRLAPDGQEVTDPPITDDRSIVQKAIFVFSFGILFRPKRRDYRAHGSGDGHDEATEATEATRRRDKDARSPLETSIFFLSFGMLCRKKTKQGEFQELNDLNEHQPLHQ